MFGLINAGQLLWNEQGAAFKMQKASWKRTLCRQPSSLCFWAVQRNPLLNWTKKAPPCGVRVRTQQAGAQWLF